jgi:hypothetical protein
VHLRRRGASAGEPFRVQHCHAQRQVIHTERDQVFVATGAFTQISRFSRPPAGSASSGPEPNPARERGAPPAPSIDASAGMSIPLTGRTAPPPSDRPSPDSSSDSRHRDLRAHLFFPFSASTQVARPPSHAWAMDYR